ncbi:hypothetical protein CRG98_034723, partial [Punica granatum]
MVARRFQVRHDGADYDLEYDTDNGLEVSLSLSLSLAAELNFGNPILIHNSSLADKFFHFLQVFRFQLFSLTSIPPDEQKILGAENDQVVSEDSDLLTMCDKLQLVSIDEEAEEKSKERKEATPADQGTTSSDAEWLKSDEELARMLQ